MVLHFAYGSNLDSDQMKCRCPDYKFVGIAKKPDYRIAFTRCSKNRKGGVADIVESDGDVVWGALYELSKKDIECLDYYEGVKFGAYRRESDFEVVRPDGATIKTYTYIVCERGCFMPHKKYLDQIINGAQEWGLPSAYIEKLRHIPYKEDS